MLTLHLPKNYSCRTDDGKLKKKMETGQSWKLVSHCSRRKKGMKNENYLTNNWLDNSLMPNIPIRKDNYRICNLIHRISSSVITMSKIEKLIERTALLHTQKETWMGERREIWGCKTVFKMVKSLFANFLLTWARSAGWVFMIRCQASSSCKCWRLPGR